MIFGGNMGDFSYFIIYGLMDGNMNDFLGRCKEHFHSIPKDGILNH